MLKLTVFVILVLGLAICSEGDQTNEAGALLTSLVRESEANLKDFDEHWAQNHPIIKGVLDSVYNEFLRLEQECNARQDAIGETEQSIENSKHYIEWIGEKIEENNNKITALEDAHCATSKLYVNGLKHNKIALQLIQFMRQAIQDKESLSLVQRRTIVNQLSVFFQMYAKDQVKGLQMLQQDDYNVETDTSVEARTEQEIGTDHIDNGREQIDVEDFESSQRRDWPTYKAELLEILDTLEAEITQKLETSQDEQINSGVSLADFKIQLESENQQLDRHLAAEAERITRLEAKTVRQQASHRECMDEINIVFETLIETRADYEEKVYQHDEKRKSLQEEVDLFVYVEQQYQQQVDVDDSYGARQVDSFEIGFD